METLRTISLGVLTSIFLFFNSNTVLACSFMASFSGDSMVCAGNNSNYLTKPTTGHYYRWVVTGGIIVSGQGKDSLWVNWPIPGSGSVQLFDSTSTCVGSITKTIEISLTSGILTQAKYNVKGSATAPNSGRKYTLTYINGYNESAAAWNQNAINLNKNFDFTFITNQTSAGSGVAPDGGMMFIMQNSRNTAIPGGNSGNLGYYGSYTGDFNESIGVEEDIFLTTQSYYSDSSASHLSLVKDNSPKPIRPQVNISPRLNNSANRKIRITWNRDVNLFEVYFDGTKRYSWQNDIVKNVFGGNPNIWFGFTGSTSSNGSATQAFAADTLIYNQAIINYPGDTICSGDSLTLTSSQGVSYLWSNGAKTRSIKIIKSGVYSVTVTDSFNCISTAIDTINLVIEPHVSASFTVSSGCIGSYNYVPITNNTTPDTGVRYIWNFGNGYYYHSNPPLYIYQLTGNYTISVTATNGGCTSTASNPVNIYTHPSGIKISGIVPFQGELNNGDIVTPDYACSGDTNMYQFSNPIGYANSDYGSKWVISSKILATASGTVCTDTVSKNPSPSQNAYFKFVPGSKFADSVLILTVHAQLIPGNCDTEITRYIKVRPNVISKFVFKNACQSFPLSFYDSSTISAGDTIGYWNWNFGDSSSSTMTSPNHIYANPGDYNVTLSAISKVGCGIPVTQTVTQFPAPITAFHVASGCQDASSVFTDSSTIKSGSIVTHAWYFGDGNFSAQKSPKYTYSKSGPYNVKLVETSFYGCKDSITKSVRIEPLPVVAFSFKNTCPGTPIYYANNTIDSATGTKYIWSFGDGHTSTSSSPSHSYVANGAYNVELTATSIYGCSGSSVQKVTPYEETVPNILYSGVCLKNTTTFGDSDRNDFGASYSWNFGDGISDVTSTDRISHTYKNAGTFKVTLTIQNGEGCVDSESENIIIYTYPVASFSSYSICAGEPLFFSNLSTGTGLTFSWNFGDSLSGKYNYSTAASPIHIYDSGGAFKVVLTVTDPGGCANAITEKANVVANPVGLWSYRISGKTVTFTPLDSTQKTYEWHFGTGDSSSVKKPVYTYQAIGKYDVKLVETNTAGCFGSYSDSITLTGLGVEPVSGPANNLNISIFPNPFENKTVISYTLTDNSKVNVSVYDIQGKLVAELKDENLESGKYQDEFDAAKYNASEGVYLLKMTVDGEIFTGRIVEIK